MGNGQSDGRIVPSIATNNAGGKPRKNRSSRFLPCKTISTGKHYLYTEIENVMETKLVLRFLNNWTIYFLHSTMIPSRDGGIALWVENQVL